EILLAPPFQKQRQFCQLGIARRLQGPAQHVFLKQCPQRFGRNALAIDERRPRLSLYNTAHLRPPRSIGTTSPPLSLPATIAPTRSVAARSGSSNKWLYRAVVVGVECPSSAPITGSDRPALASMLA